jgi:hypothetical protein
MDQGHKSYRLGPLPWSHDTLIKAYWRHWPAVYDYIKEHPGFTAQEHLETIQLALNLFLDSTDDLLLAIAEFIKDFQQPGFLGRGNRSSVKKWDRRLRKHFFSVATSAFALVDAYRRVTKKFPVAGYQKQKTLYFVENELHHFMRGLRNFISHKRILTPEWRWSRSKHGDLTQLILTQQRLREYDNWDAAAQQFIQKCRSGVDIQVLASTYRSLVEEFHHWFHDGFLAAYGDPIQEYVKCRNVLEGEEWKQHWRLLLDYGIQHQLNPYNYLHEHLTPREIAEISLLPNGSKEQVDMIIAKADEFGICDDELRSRVYKLFGIHNE